MTGVVVGIVWALWHLPLFLWPGTAQHELKIPFLGFFCEMTSLSVLFAWLHNHTNGMIWTAVFFHWIYTYAAQVVDSGVTRAGPYNWLEYVPYVLAALFISAVWQLMIFAGIAISLSNWLAVLFMMIPITMGYVYRIKVEEGFTIEQMGESYLNYQRRTKRSIPMIY